MAERVVGRIAHGILIQLVVRKPLGQLAENLAPQVFRYRLLIPGTKETGGYHVRRIS